MIPVGLSQQRQSAGFDFIIRNTADDKNDRAYCTKRETDRAADIEGKEERNAILLDQIITST